MRIKQNGNVPSPNVGSASGVRSAGAALRKARIAPHLNKYALVFSWLAIIVVFSILEPSQYWTRTNFEALLSTQAPLLLLALACIPPIIVGDLDLSVAATAGLALVVTGYLNVNEHWPIGLVIPVVLVGGLALGGLNAFLVVGMGIDCIVTTLGIGTLLTGLALGISSSPIGGVSTSFSNFMDTDIVGLQVGFWLVLLCCIVMWYILSHTPLGRRLFFVGAGRDAARLSGVQVARLRALALVIAALLSALDGIFLAGIDGSADSTTGPALLFPALAAVFLGATAIVPGRFNVWGTFVAVYFLVFGIAGLEIEGLSGWVSEVFYGASLVIGVGLAKLASSANNGSRLPRLSRRRPERSEGTPPDE